MERCGWCIGNELYENYHDKEWGRLVKDNRVQFEFMVLESAQAGLNWLTILKKRENYRAAYDGFDPEKVVNYDEVKVESLMQNTGIVRNRRKIEASIKNARIFLEIVAEFSSFTDYLLSFNEGQVVVNYWQTLKEVPATTALSDAISKDLKKRGCGFMGSTIVYAHLQATGVVVDHLVSCPCHSEILKQVEMGKC
jgi:DNA-3-methyladenine glycosylase I